ncbi:MAG TPA: CNP1-like family protein [Burkholderiales bacterium]|nr:CNP1-like family protein [Burkholderiales bacterium]
MRFLVLGLALAAGAAGAQPSQSSDWERENEERLKQSEEVVVAPPPLARDSLVELELEAPTDFRYLVDAASLSVGADRIVRYTLVALSPSGVENITFEGLRCSGEYRVYAVGRTRGPGWSGRPGQWRAVPRDPRTGQNALLRRYFCPARATAIQDAAEGARALRAGGHPARKDPSEQY